jgi:hypothetical protein
MRKDVPGIESRMLCLKTRGLVLQDMRAHTCCTMNTRTSSTLCKRVGRVEGCGGADTSRSYREHLVLSRGRDPAMRVPAHVRCVAVFQGLAASTMSTPPAACGWSVSGRPGWYTSPCSTATTARRHTSAQTLRRRRSKVSTIAMTTHFHRIMLETVVGDDQVMNVAMYQEYGRGC